MKEEDYLDKPVEMELSVDGSHLYIFFGGIAAGIAMPRFEFYHASEIIEESKIFIRDLYQCWYQNGLPGISRDIHSTAQYVRDQIGRIEPDRVFLVGNSMGGYAAILFATMLRIGEVIAFAPQTFISPSLRLRHKDTRWQKQITNTYRRSMFKRKIWDLSGSLAR